MHYALLESRKSQSKLPIKVPKKREIYLSNAQRLLLTPKLSPTIRISSPRWLLMPLCILVKISLRAILVLRKSLVDPSPIPSWFTVSVSKKLSLMPVSNNNQRNLKTQKSWFFNTSLNLKPKKTTLKLELKTQTISKRSSTLNGISFMINLIKLSHPEPRLFSPISQLVILLPNTSPTKIFSAQVEFKKKIYKESQKHLELSSKLRSTV